MTQNVGGTQGRLSKAEFRGAKFIGFGDETIEPWTFKDTETAAMQVPPTVMFHTANAWEEGDEVKLFGCCMNVVRLLTSPTVDKPV